MADIFMVSAGMIALFFTLLVIKDLLKKVVKREFCVICATVFLTWVSLLFASYVGIFENQLIVALLMGQSITGIFYLFESKIRERMKLFRLPFLLTLTFIGFMLLNLRFHFETALLILGLWIALASIRLLSNNKKAFVFIEKIIDCCKRW